MKLMILSWIAFCIAFIILKIMSNGITSEEQARAYLFGAYPTRLYVMVLIAAASFIEALIVTIIFVITM